MQNEQILERISSLKGRKNYEAKKASKLGFNSLYEYFEDKIVKEKAELEGKAKNLSEQRIKKKPQQKIEPMNKCKCC